MAYIGATDITLLLPAQVSIGTNTPPLALGEVGSIITEYEAELNAAAAHAGYAIPVSPTEASLSHELMQLNTKRGAMAHILGILFPNPPLAVAADYRKAYDDFLKALRDRDLTLPDVPGDGGSARELPRSFEVTHAVAPSPLVGAAWDP